MRSTLCAIAVTLLALATGSNTAYAQQAVLQRGYDPGLSGANLSETTLTTSNVNPTTFGLVFTLPVDDQIYAQPLYVPQVAIAGYGTRNVVYIATMSDSLYAFDADVGGAPLWYINFASSVGAVPPPIARFIFGSNTNIVGNLGILSTPVIDPSTNIMYLVACTLEDGAMVYRLHAVDITTGTEPYPNVVISGSYGGITFDAAHQTQRVSLTLSGDQVMFGFAAMQAEADDQGGYTGWVMAYNKQTLMQSGVFATITTGTQGGGVWQSGRPPAIDGAGFAYVFTGNGYQNGYNGSTNFSESALKLDPANGLALIDWFTPSNWSALDAGDQDLSSSGPLLIPNTSPSVLAGGGKAGVLYLLNTSNLGKYSASDGGVLQEESISASSMRGGPVYWQRSAANGGSLLYDWGTSDSVKAYSFNGTTLEAAPSSQGSASQIYPGGILALSANGELPGSGVLWATAAVSGDVYDDATDPGVLYAFDADNVSTELWSSTMNSARDNFGNFAKLVPPLVANGKVYVATFSDQVAVYGLLSPSSPTTATPTFSLAPGAYTGTQQVTLSDATAGATIYYTTNGMEPTIASTQYVVGAPLSVSATETIEAMAVASGDSASVVAVGSYTISASGTPPGAGSVNLSTEDDVVGIGSVGTSVSGSGLDGLGNTYAGNLLGTSISWSGSTFALGSADVPDAVSNTTIALTAGNYSSIQLLATAVNGNQPNQTFVVTYTDGTTTTITQSLSDWYTPQSYTGESIASTMAYRLSPTGVADNRTFYLYGYSFAINSAKTVASITLPGSRNVVVLAIDLVGGGSPSPTTATPTFSPAPGAYTGTQQVTLSDATVGATIYYTTNGTEPTISSAQYVAGTPLSISATETIEVMAVASGYSASVVAAGSYTISASGTPPGAGSVNLLTEDDVVGIGSVGTSVSGSGLDGLGNTYAGNLLGTSISWSGSTFALGSADVPDAVSNTTIALTAGNYSSIQLLATAVNGNQPNQTFVVTYTDGTTTTITQSLSDWYTPQSYTGESIASTMAYRLSPTGVADNRTFYLYGYSFAINSAKTVASITLPGSRNVVVLAIDLVGGGSPSPTTATPTFSPAPGAYTGTQQVTLSDATVGATIYYTTNGTEPTISSAQYVAGTPLSISATETIEVMAVASGYSASVVAVGSYTISASGTPPGAGSVNLSTEDDVVGIGSVGTSVSGSGLDGLGNTYAGNLLGTSISWSGSTFALGSADVPDAVSNTTIALTAGNYSSIQLLATAVNGNQPNQTFVVTYTDGTTTTITQSLSDWYTPQSYTGESIASTMAYRLSPTGVADNRTFYLYGYSFAINSAKTVASITLPDNRNVTVLAIDAVPAGN